MTITDASNVRSIPDVCEVELLRGAHAGDVPDLLLEVPHGATRAADFDALARVLRGPFPADLREFFFVNTDVGAPEVALRVAELFVAADPRRSAVVVRSRIPRTFVDCNRILDAGPVARASAAGEMTPGLHAWVRAAEDRELLLARYGAYREVVEATCGVVCENGGRALMVHSYAPRSVDVPVDERIVEHLRAAYAPERVETWPLRAQVDLIVDTFEGERLADAELVERVATEFAGRGFEVAFNRAYALHPGTVAYLLAKRYRGRTLCLEVRRDLLVEEFVPFEEMKADGGKVERVAEALVGALR